MKSLITLCSVLFFSLNLIGQFIYSFNSFPDSAAVYKNGELECYTPCKIKYYWRDNIDGYIKYEIKKENYKDWSTVVSKKPSEFDDFEKVFLEKQFNRMNLESTPLISFDKIRVNFADGKKVGTRTWLKKPSESIEWSGSIKVGDEIFEEKFYDISTNLGFNNLLSQSTELFSENTSNNRKLPKYIIGTEITDYQLSYNEVKEEKHDGGNVKGETQIGFDWRVLDKRSGKEVLSLKNSASIKYRLSLYSSSSYNVEVFELALIDFLESKEFIDLLNKGEVEYEPEENNSKVVELERIKLPKFTKTAELVKSVNPACVTVITDGGHGSGVIISKSGLMLTAYHVVEGVNKIDIKFASGLTLQAELKSFDKFNDVALLDITGAGFTALPLAKNGDYGIGTELLTIGTPADIELGQSISKGMLSGRRNREGHTYLQVDMAVSPGNSGGPLLTESGEILGIVQSKIIGSGVEGIGFAIPIETVQELLNIKVK